MADSPRWWWSRARRKAFQEQQEREKLELGRQRARHAGRVAASTGNYRRDDTGDMMNLAAFYPIAASRDDSPGYGGSSYSDGGHSSSYSGSSDSGSSGGDGGGGGGGGEC